MSNPSLLEPKSGFLKAGDNIINFYYSAADRQHFALLLQEAQARGAGVVLAVTKDYRLLPHRTHSRGRRPDVVSLQVTPNLGATIAGIEQAATLLLNTKREIVVLADFNGFVSSEVLLQVEAQVNLATQDKNALVITQYDGIGFPPAAMMEQFLSHTVTMVGNAFYSENHNRVPPARYLMGRKSRAAAAS
ncbi:MAG: hypothetical protein JO041_04260 [Acidobacteria bacterium]|nr:hypothetical protein [Acidobacteriota bacterium]